MKSLYIKLLAISLLSIFGEQSMASWRKVTGSTVFAGAALTGYYGNNVSQQFMNPMGNKSIDSAMNLQPKYNFSTDKDYKRSYSQPKISMNSAQLGTIGLQSATKKLLEEMDIENFDEDDNDAIKGLKWSQLITNEQRIAYLHKALEPDVVAQNFNYLLIVHYLVPVNDKELDLFFKKLHEYSSKDSTKIITMDHVDRAIAYMSIDKVNQVMAKSFIAKDSEEAVDELLQVSERELSNIFKMNSKQKLEIAWHEAAHAYQAVCGKNNVVLSQLSLGAQGFLGGAYIAQWQFQRKVDRSVKNQFYFNRERLDSAKNIIKIYLAGGIGQMIFENKKLSFSEFQETYQANIGHSNIIGSDMWIVLQELIYSSLMKDLTVVSNFQADLEPFVMPNQAERKEYIDTLIKECYEETYANLYANKDILNSIVEEVLEQGVISGDRVYKLANKRKPKYEFEMSSTEKIIYSLSNWLSWTFNRMVFYDRYGAQN